MRRVIFVVATALLLMVAGQAWAGRCLGYPESQIVWCDDFDNYCVGADPWPGYPPFPDKCATDGSAEVDQAAFAANWTLECAEPMTVIDDMDDGNQTDAWNLPMYVAYWGQYNDTGPCRASGYSWNFTEAIQAKDSSKNAVNGSDETPLHLKWWVTVPIAGVAPQSPLYFELSWNGEHAPTDYVMTDNSAFDDTVCVQEGVGPYPIICQQNRGRRPEINTYCPPLDTTIYKALALGFLAQLDSNPCDVVVGRRPCQEHSVVFDGNKWTELRSSVFPPNIGDHDIYGTNFWFEMEIKTSQMIVHQIDNQNCPESFPCFSTVPRLYEGPFNTVFMGTAPGCELDVNDVDSDGILNECVPGTTRECFHYADLGGTEGWKHQRFDTPVLLDGVLEYVSVTGACCLPDLSCQDGLTQAECEALSGVYQGNGTECATTLCCHDPFADGDGDGDVDQADFGLWQVCYDGGNGLIAGCECYDRDGDNDVDGAMWPSGV